VRHEREKHSQRTRRRQRIAEENTRNGYFSFLCDPPFFSRLFSARVFLSEHPTRSVPMEVKDRRKILGNLAALLAAPFLLGRATLAQAFTPREKGQDPVLPRITPPAHSVKRRG
jgi:hypothetical protein